MTASSHALCSAADDVADGGKPSAPPIVLKALLSAPVVVLVPIDFGPGFAHGTQGPLNRAAPSLRLNLRHCVFLI